jgi:hypothetical protein
MTQSRQSAADGKRRGKVPSPSQNGDAPASHLVHPDKTLGTAGNGDVGPGQRARESGKGRATSRIRFPSFEVTNPHLMSSKELARVVVVYLVCVSAGAVVVIVIFDQLVDVLAAHSKELKGLNLAEVRTTVLGVWVLTAIGWAARTISKWPRRGQPPGWDESGQDWTDSQELLGSDPTRYHDSETAHPSCSSPFPRVCTRLEPRTQPRHGGRCAESGPSGEHCDDARRGVNPVKRKHPGNQRGKTRGKHDDDYRTDDPPSRVDQPGQGERTSRRMAREVPDVVTRSPCRCRSHQNHPIRDT